jgi:predicted restriction endonuclease
VNAYIRKKLASEILDKSHSKEFKRTMIAGFLNNKCTICEFNINDFLNRVGIKNLFLQ